MNKCVVIFFLQTTIKLVTMKILIKYFTVTRSSRHDLMKTIVFGCLENHLTSFFFIQKKPKDDVEINKIITQFRTTKKEPQE